MVSFYREIFSQSALHERWVALIRDLALNYPNLTVEHEIRNTDSNMMERESKLAFKRSFSGHCIIGR